MRFPSFRSSRESRFAREFIFREENQNTIALIVNLGVSFVGPLLVLPLLTNYWGNQATGLWLIAIGFTSYITMLDLGIGQWLANAIPHQYAQGNREAVSDLAIAYSRLWAQIWAPLGFVAGGALWLILIPSGQEMAAMTALHGSVEQLGFLACLCGILAIPLSLFSSIARGIGLYRASVYWSALWRCFELVTVCCLSITGRPVSEALANVVFLRTLQIIQASSQARFGWATIKSVGFLEIYNSFRREAVNGLPWLLLLGVNAINFQLITTIVAHSQGLAASLTFAFNRTVSRVVTQVSGALYNGYWPVFTKLLAEKRANEIVSKYRRLQVASISLILVFGITLIALAETAAQSVEKYERLLSSNLLLWLVLSAGVAAMNASVAVVLFAGNQTAKYGSRQLMILIIACSCIGALGERLDLIAIAKILLLAEIVGFIGTVRIVKRFFVELSKSK